jgi:hypothetical protein
MIPFFLLFEKELNHKKKEGEGSLFFFTKMHQKVSVPGLSVCACAFPLLPKRNDRPSGKRRLISIENQEFQHIHV